MQFTSDAACVYSIEGRDPTRQCLNTCPIATPPEMTTSQWTRGEQHKHALTLDLK